MKQDSFWLICDICEDPEYARPKKDRHSQMRTYSLQQWCSAASVGARPLQLPPSKLARRKSVSVGALYNMRALGFFLRRSDTVGHVHCRTTRNSDGTEHSWARHQDPGEPAAGACPSSQASTCAAANADDSSRSASTSILVCPRASRQPPAGQRRRGRSGNMKPFRQVSWLCNADSG